MNLQRVFHHGHRLGVATALCFLTLGLMSVPRVFSAEERTTAVTSPRIRAFTPGETLTYEISWSKIVTAGTAVMEVKEERLPNGRKVFRFIATSRSVGVVDKVYPVNDRVQSLFDPQIMQSLSFDLSESHGKRKRRHTLTFDHASRTVVSTVNADPPQTLTIPEKVQDALSSLFYLRTMEDFTIGKTHVIDVHDSGKNWSVEVLTLGREKVKTHAGEFNTIKVKTFPRYEGVFMNKGEIFIWLTDDSRKLPVLMKSTISIGSIVTTLTDMKLGEVAR
ncbi:MAG: DUF3108 domain-containing protein [Nitrospirae bacterium]|nr:DUF3108 domain-containing protein [Nitrospirota bacterium]